jgi:hypothetical protein
MIKVNHSKLGIFTNNIAVTIIVLSFGTHEHFCPATYLPRNMVARNSVKCEDTSQM